MEPWIIFSLLAVFLWSICTIIDKIVVSKKHIINPFVFITLNGFMNFIAIIMIPFLGVELLPLNQMLLILLYGITHSAAVISYYEAIKHDEISRIKIYDQLGPIFVYALSFIFLGEFLTKNLFIGFLLFIAAGVAVSYNRGQLRMSKAIPYLILGMMFGSVGAVTGKYIYGATDFWNAFILLRIAGISVLFVLFIPKIRDDFSESYNLMPSSYKKLLSFKMLIDFSAFIFAGYAISKAPISLYVALNNSMMPAIVFLFAFILTKSYPSLIKEDISSASLLAKLVSLIFVIAGILFVNLA